MVRMGKEREKRAGRSFDGDERGEEDRDEMSHVIE